MPPASTIFDVPPTVEEVDYVLAADGPDQPIHAFLPRDGYPARALCMVRWTVAMQPNRGAGMCLDCVVRLREQIRATAKALRAIDTIDLGLGDHHVGVGR